MTNRFWRLAGVMLVALMGAGAWAADPVAVGDTVTWTNADGLTADDVVNANHCSFEFSIPGDENLPTGSVVRITKVEIASVNATRTTTSSTTAKLNDPYYVSFGNVKSAECEFITTETLAGKYIDSYTFTDTCNITIGKQYPEYTSGGNYGNMAGYGVTFLYSNGNRWSGGSRMDCTVGGTTSGFIKNGDIYPIYRITAEVVSIHKEIAVTANTSVLELNALIGNATDVVVTVADGLTIAVDAAFDTNIKSVSSTGTITLSAASQPDASYFANVAFDVRGALLRTWLTPGVVGVNFVKGWGNDTSDERVESTDWVATTGASGSQTLFDGLTKITWSASGTYSYQRYSGTEDDENSPFFHGYLDDGGTGVNISVTEVPYDTYDVVIYASTDTSNAKFRAKTVNNVAYTIIAGETTPGDADWGSSRMETTSYGVNAMRVRNLSGKLTILGGTNNGSRGGIAAIQIMPTTAADKPEPEYELALDGTDANWSEGAWELGGSAVSAPLSGNARITFSASTTLTIDATVALNKLVLDGADDAVLTIVLDDGASLVASGFVAIEGGVFKQGSASVLGSTPSLIVEDGGTFDLNGLSMNAATSVYIAGDGAGSWPWALTSSGGAFSGSIQKLYLTGDATVGGANQIVLGANWSGSYGYLDGHTLTKTGSGELLARNFNTPQTGGIIVSEGTLTTSQWNCLDRAGGTTTLTIMAGATFIGSNQEANPPAVTVLNWDGTLNTTSRKIIVNNTLNGGGETAQLEFANGAGTALTRDLTVTKALTLAGTMSFAKGEGAVQDVVVTASGTLSASGAILVGAGVTLNLGTNRPTATLFVEEGGTLAAQLQSVSDVIALSTSAQPANVILYDANGNVVSNPRVTYSDGTLTIMPPVPTLPVSGTVAFDTATNWEDEAMPSNDGDAIIELADDAMITVSGTYTLGSLTITGSGVATFSGEGSITVANISVKNGATFTRNANISATTGISIDAGTVLRLDGVTENAAISGAGAVETYGTVVLAHANTMTGGITVKPGSALSTTAAGGYGEYQSGWAYTAQRQVVVEDGGTVDINNVANNDGAVALTIAGKGILSGDVYSGAVTYSGASAITSGSRQISSLVLTGDALVDVGAGWGLVHSGWGNARLGLAGHTLTVRGTGTFPVVNANNLSGAATTGTLVMDGATLELSNAASNLAGVNVVAKGCATINVAAAPSALGSLTLKPSATGTTASNWNLPEGLVPALDTSNVDPAGLSVGDVRTLFTAPSATVLTAETIAVTTGGRYTTSISSNTVTATVKAPTNFLHYNFNNGAAVNTGAADDSGTTISSVGEGGSVTLVDSKNGKAVQVHTGYTPYWDTFANGTSPFHADEVTVTTMAQLKETGIVLWGLGSAAANLAMGLVVTDAHTAKVVARKGSAEVVTLATATVEQDLTSGWHFFAVVSDENGTKLYVDNNDPASTNKSIPAGIGQAGQLGSFHGGAFGASKVGADGYLLDDWRVYDAALTVDEVTTIRNELTIVTITITPVDGATVTEITVDGVTVPIEDSITVDLGATVSVTYTSNEGYFVNGSPVVFEATSATTAVDTSKIGFVDEPTVLNTITGFVYESLQDAIDAGSGTLTLEMLGASSTAAIIPNGLTVALVDDNHLYAGDIKVEEGGILDLSNRTAGDCVACANLILEAGAGIWLPEGVVGSVKLATGTLTAGVQVAVKIGESYSQTYTVASSEAGTLTLLALRAAAKPAAVWNADFEDGVKHGNVALNLNGNAVQNGIITITDSDALGTAIGGGVRFEIETSTITNRHLTAIVGIKTNEVDLAKEPYLVTVAHHNNNAATDVLYDKVGLLLKAASDTYQAGTIRGIWDASEWVAGNSVTGAQWPAGEDKHYFTYRYNATSSTSYDAEGRSTSGVFGTDGTTAYFDGDTDNAFYSASNLRNSGNSTKEFIRAMTLGGYYYADTTERHQRSLTGATIDYVAIFTQDDYATEDAIKAWTLASVTQAETVPATATAITGGSGVGVNLNGGTITISEPVAAAAVFVQEDTTLKFTGSGRLDVANNGMYLGPVYVAEGKTLTIDASASAITAGELIHGAVYGNVAIDEATGLAYIADGGLYVGVRPTETHTLTIVVNGNHAFGDGNFTGLDTLGIIGTGAVDMATCTLEAGEFALGAGVSLTLDGASSLDAAAMAIDGVLAAACPVTATTLTVNGEFTAAGAVTATTVKAVGSLAIAEGGSLAASTLSVDGVATASGAIAATTVTVGGSLAIEEGGSLEATTLTVAGEFTTAGNVTATTVNANGDFTVADGGQLTVNGDRGLSGTVTVAKGGTLTSGIGNAMNWDGKCVVHLYGTLEMGETSWAVNTGNGNRLYLYEGCVITGTGNENSAFDLVGTDEAIIVTGAVEVAQRLRFRADSKILVNADSRLTLSGELCYMEGQIGSLVKHGPGTLEITGTMTQPSPKGLDIAEGTVVLGSGASVAGTVRVQGEGALDVSALTSPVIAGAVTLDNFATVVVPESSNLADGVQLTTLTDEGALTVGAYATLIHGDNTYTNASVQVVDNNKLAMVAQTTHAATITGETAWADIAWTPALPEDPTGRKLIINASAGAVIDGGAIAKTADSIVFNVAQDSILTITNLTLTANLITVNGGAVKVYSADTLTGTFVGNGTVIYDGAMPASPADKFTNTNWRGTLWLDKVTIGGANPAELANRNSTLRLSGCVGSFTANTCEGTLELQDVDVDGYPTTAFTVNNGWSSGAPTIFSKLKGSGTLTESNSDIFQRYVFLDPSQFTGSIIIPAGNAALGTSPNRPLRVILGEGASLAPTYGTITVVAGTSITIADSSVWSAAGGIQVYGTVNVEGKISGSVQCHDSGKFVVTSGNAVLGDLRDFTYVTLDAGTEVDWVSVEQTKLEAISGLTRVENIVDDAIVYINFIKYNGDEVKVAKDDDNVAELEQDPQVSGDVCWYDFTFTQTWYKGQDPNSTTLDNMAGSGTGALQLDTGYNIENACNSTNGNLRIRSTPYFHGAFVPETNNFSVAMYTMMPERAGDILMAFGTVAGGYLAVVRGDSPNEIQVVWGKKADKQEIAAFSVVAATQTRHLIMFTKSGPEIAVYLDGDATPLAKETLANNTMANQFQVASIHGGEDTGSTGLQRPAATEKAELAMLRIYDYVLDGRMIAQLASDFEAESWANFAMRALDAANGTNTWYDAVNRPWSYTTDGKAVISAEVENGIQPLDDAHIVISNVSEQAQWIDVVLPAADSGAGNFTVAGTSPVIIHHSIGGHAVDVAGAISNEVDLTIYYGAINMANTRLYMTESATLTLELTEFLRDCEAAGDYTLTGICGNFGGRVSCSAESDNLFFSVDGGIKYDSDRQRYYVTVVAKRSDPQDVYLTVDGSNITVGTDTSVYYLDGTAQRYTRLVPGDTLYLDGTAGTVILNKDYGLAGYYIPAGVTLVANFQVKGTITGAGTLRCIGQHPKVDESPTTTINSLQNAEGWTGTVEIENCNLGATRLDNFGNVSSTLRLIGCSVALSGDREETIGLDLADTVDGRTYDYGLWFKGVSGSDGAVAVYPALTGRGTLRCANSATTVTYLRIQDMGGFLGTIDQAIAATGGIKLVLGDTGTADLSGLVGDSSMYVSDGTVWQVYGDVAAATNLTVKGTLLATGIAPKVAAEQIVFDGGKVVIGEPAAYPMLQGTVTGAIEVDFADGLAGDSITALAHLGAEADTTLTLTPVGNAAKYTVQREEGEQEDGTFTVYYKLIRNFFYIRIR